MSPAVRIARSPAASPGSYGSPAIVNLSSPSVSSTAADTAALPAQAWVEVSELLELQLSPPGMRGIDAFAPAEGDLVIDIGCGAGQSTPCSWLTPIPTQMDGVANDPLEPANVGLDQRTTTVTRGGLPAHSALLFDDLQVLAALRRPAEDKPTHSPQEGQAASGAVAAINQSITLRAGLDVTVNVGAGTVNPANPKAPTITINGADDASTIKLGAGNDIITVGGVRETVVGGFDAGIANAGLQIRQARLHNRRELVLSALSRRDR